MAQIFIAPSSGPVPIQPLESATTGAVGVTERGPAEPVAVASFADFTRTFGGPLGEPAAALRDRWTQNPTDGGRWWRFAASIRAFFENGGQRLVVVRVGGANQSLLTSTDFVTAMTRLEDRREIGVCVAPGMWSAPIHDALIDQCKRCNDRVAIIDAPDGLDVSGVLAFRQRFDTSFAALYHPYLEVADAPGGGNASLAPSGAVAGIYARSEREQGIHKAPANESVRAVTGVSTSLARTDQARLNAEGVNVLRMLPGRGVVVWGARTLARDSSEWKYVNVRRLFLFLEQSIARGLQWAVFEPNGDALWANIQRTVADFLNSVWRSGALAGSSSRQAFFVRCDRSTMTQDDLDNGRLVCLVGVAPLQPAEFVIFRIGQWTADHRDPP